MYADFMSHPDLFVAITDGSSAEDRMVRFVEYYLTSFHEGRKGAIAKKPYNPIIGETFHCSWKVPRTREAPKEPSQGSPDPAASQDPYQVRFVAEQVSHHPPVSGFYAECQERRMCVNTHVWTKSKFMGMSIGVSMIGEGEPACLLFNFKSGVPKQLWASAQSQLLVVTVVKLFGSKTGCRLIFHF